jgi:hypothetical protein
MDPKEFITKDSGHRMTFDSGMVRDTNAGKMLWHLVTAGPLLRRWAGLLTRGAQKYSPNNWMKASGQAELDRFRESAFRHFMQWYNGETDEDHAAAVFFNINGAEYEKASKMSSLLPHPRLRTREITNPPANPAPVIRRFLRKGSENLEWQLDPSGKVYVLSGDQSNRAASLDYPCLRSIETALESGSLTEITA